MANPVRRLLASPITGIVLLVGASALLLATGVLGYGRSDHHVVTDLAYFHTAGTCWKNGKSPYDLKTLIDTGRGTTEVGEAGIAYPPQSSSLFLFLALFSPNGARHVWMALGLAVTLLLAWLCSGPLLRGPSGDSPPIGTRLQIAAIVIGTPFISHCVWNGGSGVVAAGLLVGAWACIDRDRWGLGGILLGAATFKPQLALVPIVWLLLEWRWKVLLVGGLTAVLLSTPAYLASGLTGAYVEWLGALKYAAGRKLMDGYFSEMGLHRWALAAGVSLPDLIPLAPIAAVALWKMRSRILPLDRLPLLTGITFQFIYLHDGDLAAMTPIIPAFFRHLAGRASGWIAVALMLVIFFPQRFLRGHEVLAFVRIPALLALVVWLLVLSVRATRGPESRPEPQPAVGGEPLR